MKQKNRYGKENLHIMCSDRLGLLYDVPTNKIFKVSVETAKKSCKMQEIEDHILEEIMDEKIANEKKTIPTHSFWWENRSIDKITFHVTTRCNLKCNYCYAGGGTYAGYNMTDMKPEDAVTYIDSLIKKGVKHIGYVQFFGGEPLLAIGTIEKICEYLTDLHRRGRIDSVPVFTMITNLVLGNLHIYDTIIKYDIQLTVSIDGPQQVHDVQRNFPDGKGSYQYILQNYKMLKRQIKGVEATYTKNHVKQNISVNELKEFFSKNFNVSASNINIVPVVGVPELEVPQNSIFLQQQDENFIQEDSHILSAYNPERQRDTFCSAGYSTLSIMPNGDIYPCHMYAVDRRFCLGNLLKDIDYSFIKEKLENQPLGCRNRYAECENCWLRKICKLCPAQLLISQKQEKDFISKEVCEKRRHYYENVLLKTVSN